jgi:hypothetical protein
VVSATGERAHEHEAYCKVHGVVHEHYVTGPPSPPSHLHVPPQLPGVVHELYV